MTKGAESKSRSSAPAASGSPMPGRGVFLGSLSKLAVGSSANTTPVLSGRYDGWVATSESSHLQLRAPPSLTPLKKVILHKDTKGTKAPSAHVMQDDITPPRSIPVLASLRLPNSPLPPQIDIGNEDSRETDASPITFLSEGNFCAPRARVLLYREVPSRLSSLRLALSKTEPSSATTRQNEDDDVTSSASHSPQQSISRKRDRHDRRKSVEDVVSKSAPFFAVPFSSSLDQRERLGERTFLDIPRDKGQATSHAHLLFHEMLAYEDDVVFSKYESEVEVDPQEHHQPGSSLVPATSAFAMLLPAHQRMMCRIAEELHEPARVDHCEREEDAAVPGLPSRSSSSLSFWTADLAKGTKAFSLPSTLVRFAGGEDEAAQEQRRLQKQHREEIIKEILDAKRRKAIHAAMALGPDHLPAPRKQIFLRCVISRDVHNKVNNNAQAFNALTSELSTTLIDVCVFAPLKSVLSRQVAGVPMPIRVDEQESLCLSPSSMESLLIRGQQQPFSLQQTMLRPNGTPREAVIPVVDRAFIQQVKALVSLELCEESHSDPISRSKGELFFCVSSPSHTHRSLVERVALDVQHFINTKQHPKLERCQMVEHAADHAFDMILESPRDKDMEEDLMLPIEDGWPVELMPARRGKWELHAEEHLRLLAAASNKNVRIAEQGEGAEGNPFNSRTGSVSGSPDSFTNPFVVERDASESIKERANSGMQLLTFESIAVTTEDGSPLTSFRQAGPGSDAREQREDSQSSGPPDHSINSSARASLLVVPPTRVVRGERKMTTFASVADDNTAVQHGGDSALPRRQSKSYGQAVKSQRLRRLASLRPANASDSAVDEVSAFMAQVESGVPIKPSAKSVVPDAPRKTFDASKYVSQQQQMLQTQNDSREASGMMSSSDSEDTSTATAPSIGTTPIAQTLNFFARRRASRARPWVSSGEPVREGTIVTGVSTVKGRRIDPELLVKQRLDQLFCRFGLSSTPQPGALSEQSLDSIKRCAGCIFERPHAFCTQCGFLFCADCFYFVHRPIKETFAWYASLAPGRIKTLVTTDFMSEDGNEFHHIALSVDSLYRSVATIGDEKGGAAVPIMASATSEDVSAKIARDAKRVLDEFRKTCIKNPEHAWATTTGGGLTDEEFNLVIDNIIGQLEERLKISLSEVAASEEFSKLSVNNNNNTMDGNNSPVKGKRRKRGQGVEDTARLIKSAIDAFAPKQLSHVLEVVSKFRLRVPPAIQRLIIGIEDVASFTKPKNKVLDEKNGSQFNLLGRTTSRTGTGGAPDDISATPRVSKMEATESDDNVWNTTDIPQFEEEDTSPKEKSISDSAVESSLHLAAQQSSDSARRANTPMKLSARSATQNPLEARLAAIRRASLATGDTEEALLLWEEDDGVTKRVVDLAAIETVPDHLTNREPEETPSTSPTKAEVQQRALEELEAEDKARAAWFRRKLQEQQITNTNVILIVVPKFADPSIEPLPAITYESLSLQRAFKQLEYSVDLMTCDSEHPFLIPTKRNIESHIRWVQRIVVANDDETSKKLVVVVLSRGVVGYRERMFPRVSDVDGGSAATLVRTFAAITSDCVVLPNEQLPLDGVVTSDWFLQIKDGCDRSPVLVMDCWPVQNISCAIDEEGMGFGLIQGRGSFVTVPVKPTSPEASRAPSSSLGATMMSDQSVSEAGGATVSEFVPAMRLAFSYLPRQGGLLSYYLGRALEGRALFSRVMMAHGAADTHSKKKKKHTTARASSQEHDVTVLDLYNFISKRVETKGVRFFFDEDVKAVDSPMGSPENLDGSGKTKKKKKRNQSLALSSPVAHLSLRGTVDAVLNSPRRPSGLSPRSSLMGSLAASLASLKRDEYSKGRTWARTEDATAPAVAFPPEVADHVFQLSLANNGNPFAAQKTTESIFDAQESRRFHLELWVRSDGAHDLQHGTASPHSDEQSFEESTIYNALWRRRIISNIQSLINGSRGVTRNARTIQIVGISIEYALVLDFGAGWAGDITAVKQVDRLIEQAVQEGRRLVGDANVFRTTSFYHSGYVKIGCGNSDFMWALMQTYKSTERKTSQRGGMCPPSTKYVPVTVSILGTERDFRRCRKMFVLQSLGGSGTIIRSVNKDPASEVLHVAAAHIQSLYRAVKVRRFLKDVDDLCGKEERMRGLLESQAMITLASMTTEVRNIIVKELMDDEESHRLSLMELEIEGYVALIDDLKDECQSRERTARRELAHAQDREYLQMFETPNRWVLMDMEDERWRLMLFVHKLLFRQHWQRYYVTIDEHQERVRLRMDARAYVSKLPKLLRIPHTHQMPPPPCDFDFASSLVVFPPNFKQVYLKAKRAAESGMEE